MGLNLDLCHMLGVPKEIGCPTCGKQIYTRFDDYDIECGDPNPNEGIWRLGGCCAYCENEFEVNFEIFRREIN